MLPCVAVCECEYIDVLASFMSPVLECVAMWCSVVQCVAVCCSVLQYIAAWCCVLQCVAVCCRALQCVHVRALMYVLLL